MTGPVYLTVTADGRVLITGPDPDAVARWRERLRPHMATVRTFPALVRAFTSEGRRPEWMQVEMGEVT